MTRILHPWFSRVALPLGLVLGVGIGASCTVESVFTCLVDEDCVAEGGEGGVCEPNNLCTFPDASCPMGKRWHDRAADLAGKCYDPSDLGGGTDSVAGTAGSGSGSGESGSGSTAAEGSTTVVAEGSSSGEPPPMTETSAASSSGGTPVACDDVFGAATDYLLCEETDTTCSFNVTLSMVTCDALCMMYDGTCVEAYTNTASDCASIDVATTCDDATANDSICVCTKP